MIDLTKIKEEAQKEILDEKTKEIKEKVKIKMREIEAAKKILRNLETQMDDYIIEMTR